MNRRLQADFALVVCSLLWGATFVVVQRALADCSVFVFLAARFSLAALLMAAIFRADLRKLSSDQLWPGVAIGMFMFSGYAFQTAGLLYTTPSKAAFVTGFSIVLVPVLTTFLWRSRTTAWVWAGALVSVVGLYYLSVPEAGFAEVGSGDLLVLICALMFAFHIILIERYSPRFSVGALSFLQVATTAVLSLAALPLLAVTRRDSLRFRFTPGLAVAIAATAVLATVVSFSLQVWAQRHTSAAHTALILALEPLFAAVTSFLVVGERLGPRALAGAAVIFGGIVVVELKGPAPAVAESLFDPAFQTTDRVQENSEFEATHRR
jgi:drug/metabolite transporter (DMT)-like permease